MTTTQWNDTNSRTALLVAAGTVAAFVTAVVLAVMIAAVYKAGQRAEHDKDIATCVQWYQNNDDGAGATIHEHACRMIIE